jgi:hypothetical protein
VQATQDEEEIEERYRRRQRGEREISPGDRGRRRDRGRYSRRQRGEREIM